MSHNIAGLHSACSATINARWRLLSGIALAASFTTACGSSTPPADNTGVMAPGASTAGSSSTSTVTQTAGKPGATTGTVIGAGNSAGRAGSVGGVGGANVAANGGVGGKGPTAGTSVSAAGSGGVSTAAGVGGASGSVADGGSGGSSTPTAGVPTGSLPAIMDPAVAGPFKPKTTENVGPGSNYTTIEPTELGQEGIKHPILIWGPGAGSWPAIYETLLNHIASHGFVIVSYNSTPDGPELNKAIDWIVDESKREGSPYFNKVDTTKIAMGGQSAGSLATFKAAMDERLTTTVHINGGTFDKDTSKLIRPALFVCGDDPAVTGGDGTNVSDLARPNCDSDFMTAKVPVWYGNVIGSSHTTVIDNPLSDKKAADDPLMKHYLAVSVAWLRWQLADDQQMKALLVGPSCGFCSDAAVWKVQQKDLN